MGHRRGLSPALSAGPRATLGRRSCPRGRRRRELRRGMGIQLPTRTNSRPSPREVARSSDARSGRLVSPLGFEPRTKGLKVPCSTTELRARERPYHVQLRSSIRPKWGVPARAASPAAPVIAGRADQGRPGCQGIDTTSAVALLSWTRSRRLRMPARRALALATSCGSGRRIRPAAARERQPPPHPVTAGGWRRRPSARPPGSRAAPPARFRPRSRSVPGWPGAGSPP